MAANRLLRGTSFHAYGRCKHSGYLLSIRDLSSYHSPFFSNNSKQAKASSSVFLHHHIISLVDISLHHHNHHRLINLKPISNSNIFPIHHETHPTFSYPPECVLQRSPSFPSSLSLPSPAPVRYLFKPTPPSHHQSRTSMPLLLQFSRSEAGRVFGIIYFLSARLVLCCAS